MSSTATRGRRSIHIAFMDLPPTENHIWVHRRQGGQVYSKEATGFKQRFMESVGREYLTEIQRFLVGHRPISIYHCTMTFYFRQWDVLNKGWFEKDRKGARRAQSPFKQMDVGNRRKLLEDCVVGVLGVIDDKLNFRLVLEKNIDDEFPRVEVFIQEADPTQHGISSSLLEE